MGKGPGLSRAAFFALAALAAWSAPVSAQQDRLVTAQAAVDIMKNACRTNSAVQTTAEGRAEATLSLRTRRGGANAGGAVQGSIKYGLEDIWPIARLMNSADILRESVDIRECVLRNLPNMLTYLEDRSGPLVVLMDSPIHHYRTGVQRSGMSNSDDYWRRVADIQVPAPEGATGYRTPRVHKESAGPEWPRDRAANLLRTGAAPALIVMHLSTFEYVSTDAENAQQGACAIPAANVRRVTPCFERLLAFVQEAVRSGTNLVIYTRTSGICRRANDMAARLQPQLTGQPPEGRRFGRVFLVDLSRREGDTRALNLLNEATQDILLHPIRFALGADQVFNGVVNGRTVSCTLQL